MRSTYWLTISALLVSLGSARAEPAACSLQLATTLPLAAIHHGSALAVQVTLDGRDLSLLVDTGSEFITLSRSAVPDTASIVGHGLARGIGGGAAGQIGTVHGLHLGALHADVEAMVVDRQFPDVAGLLGMSVLGEYDVDFDVLGHQMRLFRAVGDCSHPTALLTGPLYPVPELADGRIEPRLQPRITITLDGKDFPALIDTGSSIGSVAPAAIAALALTQSSFTADPLLHSEAIGGRIATHLHRFQELDAGAVGVQNIRLAAIDHAVSPDFTTILGLNFLLRTHMWLSNSSHTVIFQVPPQASPPIPTR